MSSQLLQINARQEGERTVRFVGTTSGADRHGSRLVMQGMHAEAYLQNPIVSFNHLEDSADPDVAVIGRALSVDAYADRVEVLVEFEPGNATADKVLRKVLAGYLRGMSVTFAPITEHNDGEIRVIDEWDLWSWSIVPLPSNPAALKRGALEEDMDADVAKKLGLQEGASFDDAVAALITYLASTDESKEDREKVVEAVMAMKKAPAGDAPEEKAADDSEDKPDEKDKPADKEEKSADAEMRSALKSLQGDVTKLTERLAGMEKRSADEEKAAKTAFYRSRLGSAPEKRAATPNFGPRPDTEDADPVKKSVAATMKHISSQMLERSPRRIAAGA